MKESKRDICEKVYKTRSILKNHYNCHHNTTTVKHMHIGQKDCKCQACGKSYSQPGNLKRHMHTIHEGHKHHKCESCGKSFSRTVNLKRHISIVHETHEGHKDHKCEYCGK